MKFRLLALMLAALLLLAAGGCKKEDEMPTPTPSEDETANTPFKTEPIEGCDLTWEIYRDGTLRIKGEGAMDAELFESVELGRNDQPWQAYARSGSDEGVVIKKVVVEEGVTGLSQKCFKDMIYLELVELPTTLTEIPIDCFRGCTSLKRVFGKMVVTVQDNAFQRCERLQRLTFSALLECVGQGAFYGAGTESDKFELRLAGTEDEWAAGANVEIVEGEDANKFFADAMKTPVFVTR